jgi:predicted nucleotidyltransferase
VNADCKPCFFPPVFLHKFNKFFCPKTGGPYTEITTGLPGLQDSDVTWGDFDNDGDLDILCSGYSGMNGYLSIIYRNDGGDLFTDVEAGLIGVSKGSLSWGDYDNDSDLDILLTGYTGSFRVSKIYRNDNGYFTDINAGLTGVYGSSAEWGDYDNDGDLDILLTGATTGYSTYERVSKIYRNDSGMFTDINVSLPAVFGSSVAWGDYDNDCDLDIIMTGVVNAQLELLTAIFRNDNGIFTNINAEIVDLAGSVDLGDYNNDGNLDILLSGDNFADYLVIYRNNQDSIFTDINAGLPGICSGKAVWGDYDNDGNSDILSFGRSDLYGDLSKIYRNDSGSFVDTNFSFVPLWNGSCEWGDYDNDGDLDFIITGESLDYGKILKIYKNNSLIANTKPQPPSNLKQTVIGSSVNLSWKKSSDNETLRDGLSYNICVGSTSVGFEIVSPMSDTSTGKRSIVKRGNVDQNTSWTITGLSNGTYYWSVQAVDNGFTGSEFAPEHMFFVGSMYPPQNVTISPSGNEVSLSWTEVNGATSYKVFASDEPYGTFTDVSSLGVFVGTSWTYTGIDTKKFYYVVAVSE